MSSAVRSIVAGEPWASEHPLSHWGDPDLKKILVVVAAIAFLAILGHRIYEEVWVGSADVGPGGFQRGPALLVGTAPAQMASFKTRLEVLGELKAKAEVQVMSRLSGRLEQVLIDRGMQVKKGQLLATVEDDEIVQQIQRAEAALSVTQAGVKRVEANKANLAVQVDRHQGLYDEGLVSPQDLQDLQSRLRVAEADLELARAQVKQAEAALSELRIMQGNTRIESPLDGFVGIRYLEPGALVNPTTPIVSILDLSRVKTVVPVVESALQQLRLGLSAEITVDAYPQSLYRGNLTRISPFFDPDTRSAEVEIETPNPDWKLKPGMFARVRIDASVQRMALAIPRSGLLMQGRRQGVWRLSEKKTVLFQPVQIGVVENDTVEILEGLEEGAVIVTKGAQSLNEGDQVRLEQPLAEGAETTR